jgi:hypothetical protein
MAARLCRSGPGWSNIWRQGAPNHYAPTSAEDGTRREIKFHLCAKVKSSPASVPRLRRVAGNGERILPGTASASVGTGQCGGWLGAGGRGFRRTRYTRLPQVRRKQPWTGVSSHSSPAAGGHGDKTRAQGGKVHTSASAVYRVRRNPRPGRHFPGLRGRRTIDAAELPRLPGYEPSHATVRSPPSPPPLPAPTTVRAALPAGAKWAGPAGPRRPPLAPRVPNSYVHPVSP